MFIASPHIKNQSTVLTHWSNVLGHSSKFAACYCPLLHIIGDVSFSVTVLEQFCACRSCKPILLPLFCCASAALWCNCTTPQCQKVGFQCETNGACRASTFFSNGKQQHGRDCIAQEDLLPPGKPIYCLGVEGYLYTQCCYSDYCNSIDLRVPPGENCY